MSVLVRVLTIVCIVGAGAVGGVFLSFSTFTIGGLKRLDPPHGAAAMQSINREATTPVFMVALVGTGLTCLLLGVVSIRDLGTPAAVLRIAACTVYLLGAIALTGGYHVPRNERLGAIDPTSEDGADYWATYLDEWVTMNHVRTLASLVTVATLSLTLGAG